MFSVGRVWVSEVKYIDSNKAFNCSFWIWFKLRPSSSSNWKGCASKMITCTLETDETFWSKSLQNYSTACMASWNIYWKLVPFPSGFIVLLVPLRSSGLSDTIFGRNLDVVDIDQSSSSSSEGTYTNVDNYFLVSWFAIAEMIGCCVLARKMMYRFLQKYRTAISNISIEVCAQLIIPYQ